MGPYGPGPGPWRAGKVQKKTYLFLSDTFFSKIVVLTSRQLFWWTNNVLQVSGRNTLENAYKITSKSKFSTQNVQIPYHLHPALSNSLHGWYEVKSFEGNWGCLGKFRSNVRMFSKIWGFKGDVFKHVTHAKRFVRQENRLVRQKKLRVIPKSNE